MSRRRVLIIEDDADAANVLDAYLKRENYDVAVCGDGLAGLEVDTSAMTVTIARDGLRPEIIELTPTEFSLLRTLMHSPVKAWSRQALLDHCLLDSDALERVADTHIYNLRKKLETAGIDDVLLNVRGVGYRFRQP